MYVLLGVTDSHSRVAVDVYRLAQQREAVCWDGGRETSTAVKSGDTWAQAPWLQLVEQLFTVPVPGTHLLPALIFSCFLHAHLFLMSVESP